MQDINRKRGLRKSQFKCCTRSVDHAAFPNYESPRSTRTLVLAFVKQRQLERDGVEDHALQCDLHGIPCLFSEPPVLDAPVISTVRLSCSGIEYSQFEVTACAATPSGSSMRSSLSKPPRPARSGVARYIMQHDPKARPRSRRLQARHDTLVSNHAGSLRYVDQLAVIFESFWAPIGLCA